MPGTYVGVSLSYGVYVRIRAISPGTRSSPSVPKIDHGSKRKNEAEKLKKRKGAPNSWNRPPSRWIRGPTRGDVEKTGNWIGRGTWKVSDQSQIPTARLFGIGDFGLGTFRRGGAQSRIGWRMDTSGRIRHSGSMFRKKRKGRKKKMSTPVVNPNHLPSKVFSSCHHPRNPGQQYIEVMTAREDFGVEMIARESTRFGSISADLNGVMMIFKNPDFRELSVWTPNEDVLVMRAANDFLHL
ncbi:hypothetical protein P175DRAFT_0554877 [Aspergillus ochraceoroseus IBT 24754]|uniref:Uncharacterized protein n=1 Tax=Aspergillus ochraceoroseus IBT 24754 TaxID=1392256 RepID=A0A2T5MAU4_9EURO|nr:uncharacterized protein P175DRAFT_0554877 [Aspergillus ochraceoroseus IBT 24754]PTU25647.1 hypothetical protein P175DRAFT_0554877 [Aspergillus ochraceoroseus IBT 24754]